MIPFVSTQKLFPLNESKLLIFRYITHPDMISVIQELSDKFARPATKFIEVRKFMVRGSGMGSLATLKVYVKGDKITAVRESEGRMLDLSNHYWHINGGEASISL